MIWAWAWVVLWTGDAWEASFPHGPAGVPRELRAIEFLKTLMTLRVLQLCGVAARGQQPPGSGLPPASRSRRVGFGAWPEPCPAGDWPGTGRWLVGGTVQNSGLASDGFPGCSRSLVLSLLHPCSLLCPATQALCLGWLHSIPYPNPETARQALSSPAPGCWSHPEPLPPPTPRPALLLALD